MLGYEVLGSCACDWHTPHSAIASATAPNAFIRRIFRLIASFEVLDMMSSPLYETSPPTAFTCRGPAPLSLHMTLYRCIERGMPQSTAQVRNLHRWGPCGCWRVTSMIPALRQCVGFAGCEAVRQKGGEERPERGRPATLPAAGQALLSGSG